jgi:hypothetical protein
MVQGDAVYLFTGSNVLESLASMRDHEVIAKIISRSALATV